MLMAMGRPQGLFTWEFSARAELSARLPEVKLHPSLTVKRLYISVCHMENFSLRAENAARLELAEMKC